MKKLEDFEEDLQKIICLAPQEWIKAIDSFEWERKELKRYLLSLAKKGELK